MTNERKKSNWAYMDAPDALSSNDFTLSGSQIQEYDLEKPRIAGHTRSSTAFLIGDRLDRNQPLPVAGTNRGQAGLSHPLATNSFHNRSGSVANPPSAAILSNPDKVSSSMPQRFLLRPQTSTQSRRSFGHHRQMSSCSSNQIVRFSQA